MKDHDPTRLLSLQSAELADKTRFCPESQQIAEYYEGVLPGPERIQMEHHLAGCRYCRARIGVLERLEESHGTRRVSDSTLAAAKRLGQKQSVRRPARAPAWAAAAMIVLALFVLVNGAREPMPDLNSFPADSSLADESRQFRNIKPITPQLLVLTPKAGETLVPGSIVEWAAVPGSLYYKLSVLSNAGDVLWTERLENPEWMLDPALGLTKGSQYYLRIEAPLADGRNLRSKHVAFRVEER